MVSHFFVRTFVEAKDDGRIVFTERAQKKLGMIEIASDWRDGARMAKTSAAYDQVEGIPWADTGYIGEGFSKRAIYVCDFFTYIHFQLSSMPDQRLSVGTHQWLRVCSHANEGGLYP